MVVLQSCNVNFAINQHDITRSGSSLSHSLLRTLVLQNGIPPGQDAGIRTTASASRTPPPDTQVNTTDNLTPGFEDLAHTTYRGISSFTAAIDQKIKETLPGTGSPYVLFSPVTQQQFAEIEQIRDTRYKALRFTYLRHKRALVVKVMPGAAHEIATREFANLIVLKSSELGYRRGLVESGCTTFTVPSGGKEGDTTFKPREFRRSKHSWPTLVIECGVTQSPTALVAASHWWLVNSEGEVKVVILISLSESTKHIRLQKWEPRTEPNQQGTGEDPNHVRITPVKTQELDITGDVVNGAPLRLEFEKLMLRKPQDREGDLIFHAYELAQYAADIWDVTQ